MYACCPQGARRTGHDLGTLAALLFFNPKIYPYHKFQGYEFEKANKDIDNYAELLAGDKQSFKRKYGKHWESVMETKLLLLKMEIGSYERCAIKNNCPNRATAIIEYTAANSFGTPLANVYECLVNYRDDLKSSVGSSVYIDGFQHLGWVVKSAKEGIKP